MVWNAGDEVAHHILLPVRRLCTSLKVEEAHNQTDIARGPVFYCAEAADLSQPRLHNSVHAQGETYPFFHTE